MTGKLSQRPLAQDAPFPFANKLERIAWGLVWLLLARFTPPPLHGWRRLVLRLFGARIDRGARIYASAVVWLPRNLEVGADTIIGPGVRLYNQGRIRVGANTVISQRAHLCASTHRISDPGFELVVRPITVGNGCWIAAEAFVGPGVTMGDGSVLGARAALFSDSEELGVYQGNPAKLVRQRHFDGADE